MDIVERLTLEAAQADTMLACEHRQRYEFAAGLLAGRRVLDLCCGSGYGTAILAGSAESVVGVDHDLATIETAQATVAAGSDAPNVHFEAADALAYLATPLAERFDAIVCFEGLEHLSDLPSTLARLREHGERGIRLLLSVPNDKLSNVENPFHLTTFGYDEAIAAFAGFPGVRMVPQFLAEGALIVPPQPSGDERARRIDVQLRFEDRDEPEYANHFIFCVGFAAEELDGLHHGRLQLSAAPIFNRWSEDLKRGASALRRENARLARGRLGKGGSAAASALNAINVREAHVAELEERCRLAEDALAELGSSRAEPTTAGGEAVPAHDAPPDVERVVEAVAPAPLRPGPDGNPNGWEQRHRRAAEVLIPWIERTTPLAGRTVLEYGCGNGAVSCAFAARAERLIGLDIDPAAVEAGQAHAKALGLGNVDLSAHPLDAVLDAAAAHRGSVDVFLLYAVLEHLTVSERLTLLRLAREVVKPDGAIVVCETPNRLIYLDHHTAQLPFFHLLPDELALELHGASARSDFTGAIEQAAATGGRAAALDAIARWGRGVSFHEFEAVFGARLDQHVIASSYDPELFGERPIHPEEIVLARYLSRVRPDLAPAWSRYWLDVILSPRPLGRRPPFIWPWTARTTDADGVGWTEWENLRFVRPQARLTVELPQPTRRLLLGSVTLDGGWASLYVRPHGDRAAQRADHRAGPGVHAFTSLEFAVPASRFTVQASAACYVVLIGYEA